MTEPFFRLLEPGTPDPEGTQRVLATGSTAGPWFPDAQHMGPPSALLVRALERCAPREGMALTRLTVEVLGRVPMGELTISSRVERAGRTIELVVAELVAGGRAVARATGWRLAVTDTTAAATDPGPALPPPEEGRTIPNPPGWLPGYLDAVEWRWLAGHLGESGPGRAWGRLRVPVVADEEPTPWQRLAAVADSTNGAAARLDLNDWLFVNTDLTLHVHRAPRGEWIGLDADSVIGPEGAGLASSVLHDRDGPVGRAAQALTVRPR
ncbi:thioesterase family protein [Actinomycetospora sp. C-140]